MAASIRPDAGQTRRSLNELSRLGTRLSRLHQRHEELTGSLRTALDRYREAQAAALLNSIPVEQLSLSRSGIRVAPLQEAGFRQVGQLLGISQSRLERIDGVGPVTAQAICETVEEFRRSSTASVRIRPDPRSSTPEAERLVTAAVRCCMGRDAAREGEELHQAYQGRIARITREAAPAKGLFRWMLASAPRKRQAAAAAAESEEILSRGLSQRLNQLEEELRQQEQCSPREAWQYFEEHSPACYAVIEEVCGVQNAGAARGDLAAELVEQVERCPLDTSLLRVTLRSYQLFGAKYILTRQRALLGDEMGLGKTVQAIAVMADLYARGRRQLLVVCPAGVLVNWCREIPQHSLLPVHRLYGDDREEQLLRWQEEGGVGVTTYETLQRLDFSGLPALHLLVADEAHYVKNPQAQRTRALMALAERAEGLLFMTGTPLENRVEEMCVLLGFLDPQTAGRARELAGLVGAPPFREAISPVYLRRKREDVLTELPDLTETADWCDMTAPERAAYRRAVLEGNFMAMRRAAWTAEQSSKAERLLELCEEAGEDGRKVLVFTFFRDVQDRVQQLLGERCLPPINGSVTPGERQEILDRFAAAPAGTALCCQVTAGGVGLNIQAASVVIFCEPQLKPSTESQAISRAYRMGQTQNVLVHRLLNTDSIDERILELLEQKQELFDDYADESAVDAANRRHSEREWIRQAVAAGQERLSAEAAPL